MIKNKFSQGLTLIMNFRRLFICINMFIVYKLRFLVSAYIISKSDVLLVLAYVTKDRQVTYVICMSDYDSDFLALPYSINTIASMFNSKSSANA